MNITFSIMTFSRYCYPEMYVSTNYVNETVSAFHKITSFYMFVYLHPTLIQEGFKVAGREI